MLEGPLGRWRTWSRAGEWIDHPLNARASRDHDLVNSTVSLLGQCAGHQWAGTLRITPITVADRQQDSDDEGYEGDHDRDVVLVDWMLLLAVPQESPYKRKRLCELAQTTASGASLDKPPASRNIGSEALSESPRTSMSPCFRRPRVS